MVISVCAIFFLVISRNRISNDASNISISKYIFEPIELKYIFKLAAQFWMLQERELMYVFMLY